MRRQLKADGASKSFINDQPASVALLRQIAGVFIEIHGQHDDRGLANSSGHRVLLDRYAKVEPEELAQAWHRLTESKKRLDLANVQIENARREEDLLKAHYEELKAFSPLEDEETGLVDLRASLQKGEKLTGDLDELRQVWEGPNSPLEVLRAAARKLERINTHDELLTDALAALDRAMVEAEEAETKISCVADGLANTLPSMKQKLGCSLFVTLHVSIHALLQNFHKECRSFMTLLQQFKIAKRNYVVSK